MQREAGRRRARRGATGWRALIGTVGALCLLAAGCSTHEVAATRTCTTATKGGKVVALSNRGAIGLAKVGLTPKALKLQQKCK